MRTTTLLLAVLTIAAPLAGQTQETAATTAYRVDSEASWLRVLAYPDGPLRRFGHHHVISHHSISGTVSIAPNPLDSAIQLEFAVADFAVDDPEMRALEGENFEKEVSQKDVDGTRANMLGEKLLHGEQFAAIQIQSREIQGSLPDVSIVATVTVKEMEHTVTFPAQIELADDAFTARGEIELTHGEIGLSAFSAAGGALRVRDLLILKYEISGVPETPSE